MSGAREYLQVKFLKTLEPLSSLSIDKLEEIANKSQVEELPPGRVIFRQGERDSRSTYLLSGTLELQVTGNPRSDTLKAKTADSRYPVAQEWPRPSTCRSKTNVVLLHIDSDLLEILLSNDPSGTYEVTEIGVQEDPESDWMLKFLQSPAFLQLPTENIQTILVKLEEMPVKAGDVVIKQGSADDYYYIVKQGKCSVSRRPAPKTDEIRLAILGPGDGFGEEALITNGKRNATVTVKESGVLMRLSKSDFHDLLVTPMLREIDHATMMSKVKAGAALLDVRTNKEFNSNGIQGAQNIPLSMMRVKSKDLNATREHIIYCNDSTQSRAAAFLLAQQSMDVFVLKGGLNKQDKPFSPATTTTTAKAAPEPTPATTTKPAPVKIELEKPAAVAAPINELPELNDKSYIEHKQHAEKQAEKATDAEFARKFAVNKTDKLQEQSNALLAQADRLANKTAQAEEARQKNQAEIDALKQEALEQREKILASAKSEVEKGKEFAKQQEQEANKIREEAEQARKRAEQELARIKTESESVVQKQSELDAELKRAEVEKQQAERAADVAKLIAQQEAEEVKAEAEAVKQKALKEAERIRNELETRKTKMLAEEKQHQETALNEARRKAELSVAEASKAAEDARRQASLEADAIRKQALKEAEGMRMQLEREKQNAAEQSARIKAEEELKRQQIEDERRQALEKARVQAESEAEAIRQKAIQEAQIQAREQARRKAELEAQEIRQKTIKQAHQEAREEARRTAEAEAEKIRQQTLEQVKLEREQAVKTAEAEAQAIRNKTIEEVSRKAMETAQLEADAIRRAAIEEAGRLRSEMEQTRQLVETEAARARTRIEEESAQHQANQAAYAESAQSARETAIQAAQEAELRAAELEAEQEAKRQALQLEEQRIAEEQARIAAQVEQQRQAEALRQQQANEQAQQQSDQRSQKAKQMAQSLRSKLDKHETAILEDDIQVNMGRGPKLAKAKLHVVKDKTILEGEEDIFVFKAPSARPPSREEAEKLLQQAEVQLAEQSRNELPSFDLDYTDDEPEELVVDQESEFSESILLELDNITASSAPTPKPKVKASVEDDHFGPIKKAVADNSKPGRSKSSLIALAASVVVMVTISIVAITRPTYLEVEQVASVSEQQQPTRGLAAIRARTGNNKSILEDKMKTEAEEDFNKMLSKWRKQKR